jgi:peptidoglycan/LPS O-acetylase OafA/YrhL
MPKNRIEILYAFRAIAIISVLIYHLTNPWTTTYPHPDFLLHIFKYGYLGVNFFFMISGFVICYSLENTPNLLSFYRNRFARLFPAMFLCTILIIVTLYFLDDKRQYKDAHELKNALPGLTFINPQLWSLVTGANYRWLNGSFWSIWVEVQFYAVASGVYFANKANFHRNLLLVGIGIFVFKYIPIELVNHYSGTFSNKTNRFIESWRRYDEIFNITFWVTWFLCGATLYYSFTSSKKGATFISTFYLVLSVGCLTKDTYTFFTGKVVETITACITIILLFLMMIYYESSLSFLKNPLLCRIGIISYSVYLIHEQIGILLINKYEKYMGNWSGLAPFLVIAIFICFGELSYRFYESKVSRILRH